MNTPPAAISDRLKAHARDLGFDACGVARAGQADPEDRLGRWIADGFHADMDWIPRSQAVRQDVAQKLPGARSVVVVAQNYYLPRPAQEPGTGKVARYAWGRDYHKVVKKPLIHLARWLDRETGSQSYACVDSGPVLERSWAEKAGLGWVGKNSLLMRRDIGSWFFLGVVISTADLNPDPPYTPNCGTCRACIDACPTGAIVADQVVDARKCISYQTIENRREIPAELHAAMGDWVFGCDICQEVCPWNRFAQPTHEPAFQPRPGVAHPELDASRNMDQDSFDQQFAGTPVRRTKAAGMRRNAAIAMKNSGQQNTDK